MEKTFFAKLFKKMDDPYVICKAIMDETNCEKERYQKIFAEIQQEDAILITMAEIAAETFVDHRDIYHGFYDEDEKQADYKEFFNSLASKLLERMDTRNSSFWEKYMKDKDDYDKWSVWCNQWEKDMNN